MNNKKFSSPLNKVVFIHIPKTAGSSISDLLGINNPIHTTAQQYREKLGWIKYHLYFKFTIVRNPWDRFLSLYNYARMPESIYHSAINPSSAQYGKHLDYDLLKDASLEQCAYYLMEGKLLHDKSWNHWQPQINWIRNKKGKIGVNFVGRFENLEKDIAIIKKKLNISRELGHKNASSKTTQNTYRTYFNESTKKIITNYYREDIKYFNYKF